MNKLIIKTAAITVACIIAFLGLLFGVFALFYPRAIATVGKSLNNYSVAVTFFERQYNLTGSAIDIADLLETLDEEKDCEKTVGYARKFINDFNGYDEFITGSGVLRFGSAQAAEEYYYAKFVRSGILTGNYDEVLNAARKFFSRYGYSQRNPYTVIVSVACSLKTVPADKITEVRDDISSKKTGRSYSEIEQMEFDIAQLNSLLNS